MARALISGDHRRIAEGLGVVCRNARQGLIHVRWRHEILVVLGSEVPRSDACVRGFVVALRIETDGKSRRFAGGALEQSGNR